MTLTTSQAIERIEQSATYRLWTIQRWEVWQHWRERGVLRADGRRVWPEFRFAYRWLMRQMAARLPHYLGNYPLWAWYHPKPDLRHSGYLNSGTHAVRIEFMVPASRVLLSDFDAWHYVLNGSYLPLTEREERAWERRLPQGKFHYQELPPNRREEVEKSWERIFDFRALAQSEPGWVTYLRYIQAAVEEIYLSEVINVYPFLAC